jgi:flagellar biosynthesis/type III secretory pathway chaperone
MENIAAGLENLFLEMLSSFKKLKAVCEQEKDSLSDIDVDTLWKTTEQKKKLTAELQGTREKVFTLLEQKKIMARHEAQTTPLSDIIAALPLPLKTKSELKELVIRLNLVKEEIRAVARENTRFVNESLHVAKGMITMLTGGGNKPQYSRMGQIQGGQPVDRYLIQAQV